MTEQVKEAIANLRRTLDDIRHSSAPSGQRLEQGDFFMFPTPALGGPGQERERHPDPKLHEPGRKK